MERLIKLLKLHNGVDLVGEVTRPHVEQPEFELKITFKKLCAVAYQQVGQGQVTLGFQSFFLCGDDSDVTLRDKDILAIMPAPKRLVEAYIEATTNIKVVGSLPGKH